MYPIEWQSGSDVLSKDVYPNGRQMNPYIVVHKEEINTPDNPNR